jgi:hypothetical protein
MKPIAFLARLATLSFAAFLAAVAFNAAALACLALTVAAFVLLITVADYTPRHTYAWRRVATVVPFPTTPARPIGSEHRAA